MLHVPEQQSLLSEYHFVVPDLNTTSYITIVCRNVSQLRLDNGVINGESRTTYGVNSEPYEVVALPIPPGYHTATNIQGETFSLYVYGKQKPNLGYGFVAGFKIQE